MGKRSDFERVGKDFYPTIDPTCLTPFFRSIMSDVNYAEPCYGGGDLEKLMWFANCVYKSDIENRYVGAIEKDALDLTEEDLSAAEVIVTNPPYSRKILLPLIEHFTSLKETWLLLPADILHNQYFADYVNSARLILSVGRLYWQENRIKGKDNYCWIQWTKGAMYTSTVAAPEFLGREV
jgi:hypothetical protein